jgi:hypothetical protein
MSEDRLTNLAMSWLDTAKELREEVHNTDEYTDEWLKHMIRVRNARFLGAADALEKMAKQLGELDGN